MQPIWDQVFEAEEHTKYLFCNHHSTENLISTKKRSIKFSNFAVTIFIDSTFSVWNLNVEKSNKARHFPRYNISFSEQIAAFTNN